MSRDNFSASHVQVGDQSNFRQGHDFHAPVTIISKEQYVRTPLHDAVAENDEAQVEKLLGPGADINACDPKGYTPLNIAIWNGDDDMVKFLLDKGAPVENLGPTMSPLHAAIVNGNRNVAEMLLDRGANKGKRSSGGTPLTVAASKGEYQLVTLLLERGVNVNARNTAGQTPLYGAVVGKYTETVKILLQHGAIPSQADYAGSWLTIIKNSETLASIFRTYGSKDVTLKLEAEDHEDALRSIKAKRFDIVNNPDERNRALIHFARMGWYREVKVLLLKEGASLTATEYEKDALWNAVNGGHMRVIQLLLDAGANPSRVYSPDKDSVLHRAVGHRRPEILKMLLDCGADVNVKNSSGYTPLHLAAMLACEPVVLLLLGRGADMSEKDHQGYTALNRASFSGADEVVRVLSERAAANKTR